MALPVVYPWPPIPLPKKVTQNLESGLADPIQRMGGNAVLMKGHTDGGSAVSGAPNPAPRNPSGDFGHDHSGGYFGKPLFRTVATFNVSDVLSSNLTGRPTDGSGGVNTNFAVSGVAPSGSATAQNDFILPVWVPPCDPVGGAYFLLGTIVYLDYNHTNVVVGDTVQLKMRNLHPALASNQGGSPVVCTLTVPTVSVAAFKVMASSANASRVKVVPGAFNPIKFQFALTAQAGGSNRSADVTLYEVEFGVYSTS